MTKGKARILCIDDEEMIRQTMGDYLTDSGFEIIEAANGREGLEIFQQENPDLILVDLRMPEIDGLDVLAAVTQKSPETPIIVVSGTGVLEDAIEALRRGAWDYITKPVEDMAILEISVVNALKHAQLLRENRQYQENLEHEVKKRTAELHDAHEKLKEQHVFLRTLIESIPNPIFYKNVKGEYMGCNQSFCRILGVTEKAVIGKKADDFLPENLVPLFKETDQFIFERHNVQTYEYSLRFPDGTLHNLFTTKAPFINLKGEIAGIVGVISDITNLRQAEEEKTLLEDQLRHSQKMEAVGTLAGGVAHDFNNIFQAMSGYIQLLLMKKDKDDPDRKYLTKIDQSTIRATELVRRLLTFSRKSETRFQPVNLNLVVANTIHLLEQTIPRMIQIEMHPASDLPGIYADPSQIEQVIINIAANAFDAMPEGGRLVFETESIPFKEGYSDKYLELKPGNYVLLKISDTGHGMDEEVQKHIFEPFFTTKEVGKGTGLGLATVYGIVKSHNGRIACYSEPGLGTTFKIYLPVQNNKTAKNSNSEKDKEKAVQAVGGKETLLAVDDEDTILDMAQEMLEEHGYTVIKARTGEEAIEVYRGKAESVDLIILDLGMPGMGGEKSLKELLKINPKAKVIVASGYSAHKMATHPRKYGAADFISKPYHMNILLQKIRDVLDSKCS